jgi:hypothetical protein
MTKDTLTSTGRDTANQTREWGPWTLIPDQQGAPYKMERVRAGEEEGTLERFTVWRADDPRDDPHDHPWPFVSRVLTGGYSERRYRRQADGTYLPVGTFTYRAGDWVTVPAGDAHVVFDVLPGTTTHMTIGRLTAGPKDWGHVVFDEETETLVHVKNVTSPEFLAHFRALNTPPA